MKRDFTNRLRSYSKSLLSLSVWFLLVFTVLQIPASRQFWLADLANFFRPHLVLAAFMFFVVSLLAGTRMTKFAASVVVVLNAFLTVHTLDGPTIDAKADAVQISSCAGRSIRLVTANLFNENRSTDAFLQLVSEENPDIVLTQETTELWNAAIDKLDGYPYHSDERVWLRNDMKMISRFPIVSEEISSGGARYRDLKRHPMRFEIKMPSPAGPLVVYLIHPESPRDPARWQQRNMYLQLLSESVAAEPQSARIIVAGDWNTPPWSPYFQYFLRLTGLKSMDAGWWLRSTRIFRKLGSIAFLGTPIDHVVVSAGLRSCGFRIGPKFGSNHLPVIADIGF
ncbi:endonuclease/exonuclease/phosphatase family protein [Hoeflea alexandrii]